jgi:transcription elongation factor GreA
VFPLRSAGDYLTRIPSDRLDAMLRKDRELLREEAEKDPLRLLSRALAFKGGPLEGKELKAMLVPAVVDEARWSDWWGGVRFKARKSPAFEIAGGPNPLITPRSASIAPGNDLRAQFRIEGAFWDRVRLVRQHVKDSGPAEVNAAFVVEALDALGRSAASVPEKLALAFLREDARKAAAGAAPSPPAEFPGPGDLAAVLRAVPVAEYKNRILEEARRRLPDEWPQVFAGLLFNDDPESWESAVQALVKAGRSELFAARVPAILSAPGRNPWAFLWLAKNALQGHLGGIPAVPGPTAFVDLLLGVVHDARTDRLCEGAEAKKVAAKARGLLTAETLRKAFEGVTEAEAKRLWHRVRTCGLSATVLQRAENVVADLYPDLIGESSAAEEEKKKDDILWTTLAGLNRRRRDYDQLMNEEFPKNAADLGEAISKGDLSENAEYTAAREKQRELIERASRMEEELRKAHVFDTAAVSADVAGIGTQIEVAEEGKQVRSFTLLGPWDTDIDRGLISYLSPIGQALLGRKVGEKVQVQAPEGIRVMEVRSIRRAPQIEAPPSV